jgi:hypothetical protein
MATPRRKTYNYNPTSLDSVLSTIIKRLDDQDEVTEQHHAENKKVLVEIKEQTTKTNGRVLALEASVLELQREDANKRKRIARIAALVSLIASPALYVLIPYIVSLFHHK